MSVLLANLECGAKLGPTALPRDSLPPTPKQNQPTGWCITRHFLHRREVCVAGCILAFLYASVSVQMSMVSPLAAAPMVVMYLAMLAEIGWSIFNNLRILKAQLLALRTLGVDPTTTPALTKYRMFVRLALATLAYAGLEVVIHSLLSGDDKFWIFLSVHQAMELTVAISIGYTFRAQPFNILFTQVQEVASQLADQMLPSITTIEVKPDMLQGDNLIAWRSDLGLSRIADAQMPPTLVVLNPGDEDVTPPRAGPVTPSHTSRAAGSSRRAASCNSTLSSARRVGQSPSSDDTNSGVELRDFATDTQSAMAGTQHTAGGIE